MGAMVLYVAHRFEHALLPFCSLLFHRSNFKDFYCEQARTVIFPIHRGYASTLHHTAISCHFQFPICANRRIGLRYGLEQWLCPHHSTYLL